MFPYIDPLDTMATPQDAASPSSNPLLHPINTSTTFSLSSYWPSLAKKSKTASYIIAPFKASASSSTNTATSPLSPSLQQKGAAFSSVKRWRWWHFMGIFVFLLIATEMTMIFNSYKLLHQELSPIRIGKTQQPPFGVCVETHAVFL